MLALHSKRINNWALIKLDCVDSTNKLAKQEVQAGLKDKTVIVADMQTNGYGRADHLWESSSSKGLWMSAVLPVTVPTELLSQSTLVLAVAVQNAIKDITGICLQIKWPNDLLKEEKKYAGLLVEFVPTLNEADFLAPTQMLVLGVGLNVNQEADDFSDAINQKAASLSMLKGQTVSKSELLESILNNIDNFFSLWQGVGFAPIRKKWLESSHTIGRTVRIASGYKCSEGVAVGLSEMGALEVKADDGTLMCVDSGEIFS